MSKKYVSAPSRKAILADQMSKLHDSVDQIKLRKREKEKENIKHSSATQPNPTKNQARRVDDENDDYLMIDSNPLAPEPKGSKMGLYERLKDHADKATDHIQVEDFLTDGDNILGSQSHTKMLQGDDCKRQNKGDKKLKK